MSDDQLRAKSLAVFHSLVSTWSNDLRNEVSGLQDDLLKKLDGLQDQMSKYEENIDEERILAFVREVSNLAGGGGGDGGGSSIKSLRQSLTKIDEGTSLTEVLTLLLAELAQFAPRVALFILKGGSCIGWNGRGFDDSPGFNDEGIKRISVPTSADTVFRDVINSRSSFVGESNKHPDNIQLLSRVGNVLPSTIFATPLVLHDRIAAIVYADSGDGPDPLQGTEALEILTAYSSKLLDALSAQKSAVKTGERVVSPATPPPPSPPAPAPHLTVKWTPFFRPGVKVVKQACSMKKGAEKSEEKSHEAQPCFQGESCLGGTTRAGDSGGTIPAAQGSREPDLQVEAAAFGERDACFRDRRGGRRRCLDARGRTAPENRGADDGARFFITRARSIAMTPRRELVEPNAPLSMRWQCELLGVNRSSLYYEPVEPDGEQLALMRRMDELHLKHPFFGSRMMTQTLKAEGSAVNRKRVQRLMRLMGLESTAPKPNTSKPAPEHTVYPYLLRNLTVSRINQVWAADITYIPMARGFVYLVAVIDWYSRRVLAWRLSNTLETTFCVEAVNEAVARYGRPAIFNTDQGSQFTSEEFTSVLLALEIKISMDGKGRCIDNIFVERLWRSLKYEEVYLYAYDTVQMARAGIACYFDFFNDERPHKALGYQTPASFYDGLLGEVA